jgi:prepilin signal peptidase PulO-like enzyme (type II secretory pathway)
MNLEDITPFLAAYFVLAGLMLGSFINLAADRMPRGESIVSPGSHCRACGRRLTVVDLIPVAGYLIRRGRCATCGTPIGASAPVVEALSGTLVLAPILVLGPWRGAILGVALVAAYGAGVVGRAMRQARRETLS